MLRRQEVEIALERSLALLAQVPRVLGQPLQVEPLEPLRGFPQQRAHVLDLRRLHPDPAEGGLQGQLDRLLRLPDDVRVLPRLPLETRRAVTRTVAFWR